MDLNKVKIYTDACNRNNIDVIFYFVTLDSSSGLYTFGKRAPSTQVIQNEKCYES